MATSDYQTMSETTTRILHTMASEAELQPKPTSNKQSKHILDLPNELILEIVSYLPEHSKACFSLTCKAALVALGDQYIKNLRNRKPNSGLWNLGRCKEMNTERRQFLKLLDADLPDQILCYYCDVFHKPYMERHNRPTMCRWYTWLRYNEDFPDFTQVQYAMKRHRLGFDSQGPLRRLDSRFSIERTQAGNYDPMPWLQGRIVTIQDAENKPSTRLYVKYETRLTLPLRISPQILVGADNFIQICAHLQQSLRLNFECQALHYFKKEAACRRCRGLKCCKICRAEYLCYIDRLPDPMSGIVVTAWMDLGEGKTPNDPVWTSHSYDPNGREADREIETANLGFERGSLKAAYEKAGILNNGGEEDEDANIETKFPLCGNVKALQSWSDLAKKR